MKRAELNAIKAKIAEKRDKANDLETLVAKINSSPLFSQFKKLLPDEVLAVLEKYGHTK
jgi:hypothetical protein